MPLTDPIKRKEYNSIWRWKNTYKIDCDDFKELYKRYNDTTHCELCEIELCEGNHGSNKKAIDHDHITNKVRHICCHSCNMNMKLTYKSNKTGHSNITYNKRDSKYVFRKQIKGKTHSRNFDTLEEALEYKSHKVKFT